MISGQYLQMGASPYSYFLTFCDCLSCLWKIKMYAEPSNVCILKLCSNLSVKSLALMEHEESYLHLRLFFNPCELEHLDDKGNGV